MAAFVRAGRAGIELDVWVAPRASRSRVQGVHDGRLKVQLAAPPVDGAANEELMELLSGLFGRPRRDVTLLKGEASRRKTVAVAGATLDEAARVLGAVS